MQHYSYCIAQWRCLYWHQLRSGRWQDVPLPRDTVRLNPEFTATAPTHTPAER